MKKHLLLFLAAVMAAALIPSSGLAVRDVFIDNTTDSSVSWVIGKLIVTDPVGGQSMETELYRQSASVTYSTPRTTAVQGMINDAYTKVWNEGKKLSDSPQMETGEQTGKVWDDRKYETVEETEEVRTHIASGDYGKETFYTITGTVTVEMIVDPQEYYLCLGCSAGGGYTVTSYNHHDDERMTDAMNMAVYETEQITLTASADEGYVFKGWYTGVRGSSGFVEDHTDELVSADESYSYTVNENKNLYALFEEVKPTAEPTSAPTAKSTAEPTAEPTAAPTAVTTAKPTAVPTAAPTAKPTAAPTAAPTAVPTAAPTATPVPGPAAGTPFIFSGAKYVVTGNDEAEYAGPEKRGANITVPDTVELDGFTLKVTSIAPRAFLKDKKLKTFTIGANIITIGDQAFKGCIKLKTVKGGANVKLIGNGVFQGCKVLKKFPVMNELETIGTGAFKGCVKLTKFTLGEKVSSIGKNAFNGCKALKKLIVKTGKLTKANIGKAAFKGINSKATIKCPKAQKKAYQKLFVKKGAPKGCKFK